jgi:hypothetical protein
VPATALGRMPVFRNGWRPPQGVANDGSIPRNPAGCGPPQPRPRYFGLYIGAVGFWGGSADWDLFVFVTPLVDADRYQRHPWKRVIFTPFLGCPSAICPAASQRAQRRLASPRPPDLVADILGPASGAGPGRWLIEIHGLTGARMPSDSFVIGLPLLVATKARSLTGPAASVASNSAREDGTNRVTKK